MSKLVEIVNEVRKLCDQDWLTDSQMAVLQALTSGFHHQRVLNVFGGPGVGKTVLAWVLERMGYGVYVFGTDALPPNARRILLDNFPGQRRATRLLIEHLDDLGVSQAVVFSQRRVDDDVPSFEVSLTADDMAKCRANLYQTLNARFTEDAVCHNLHEILQSVL